MDRRQIIVQYEMMSHSNIPVYESVITVTRTTVAVQALQIRNISLYCALFCFYSQPGDHPLRTLLLARTRARTPNLLSCAMVNMYARSSSTKARYQDPSTSFKLINHHHTAFKINWPSRAIRADIYRNNYDH